MPVSSVPSSWDPACHLRVVYHHPTSHSTGMLLKYNSSYLDGGFVGHQLPLEALVLLQQVLNPLKVPPVVLGAHF